MSKRSASMQIMQPETSGASTGFHPDESDIAFRAHEIFVERGSGPGQDLDDWLQAERELMASSLVKTLQGQVAKPSAKPTNIR